MHVREFDALDYEIIAQWWKGWGWPQVPLDCLPSGTALVVSDQDTKMPLAMGFLYTTETNISWIEWITSNPTIEREKRIEALNLLIRELVQLSKRLKHTVVFTSMNPKKTPGLIAKMRDVGFVESDSGMTNLILRT